MSTDKYTLGFIGIGLMGRPMTLRLLNAGYFVNVWNRTPDKCRPVVDAGARLAGSAAELTERSDIVITCLADTAAVEAVALGSGGVAETGAPGKLLIDLSSIHPEATRRMAEKLEKKCGMGWVDAPVSGGVAGAESGSLAIMAGGNAEDVAVAREVLSPLYRQLTHMGAVGSGQITKICNQMIVGCNVMVIAEMIALAKKAGVDAEKIPQALAGGFADSRPLQIVGPEMASEIFEPVKWKVKTLLKDLNMAGDVSETLGSPVPLSGLAAQLMRLHGGRGNLDNDPSTLIRLYRQE
ncbi:MAG: NAD(P)-dependent oxidoreductase [Gammaproteobacteria bacterium]